MGSTVQWKSISWLGTSVGRLSCDLTSEVAMDLLFSADVEAAKNLLSLHRQRRTWLYNALTFFYYNADKVGTWEEQWACTNNINGPKPQFRHVSQCHSENSVVDCKSSPAWWRLKAKMRSMLDVDASGNQFLEKSFFQSEEVDKLVTLPCYGFSNPETESILREYLQHVVDRLPKTNESFRKAMEPVGKFKIVIDYFFKTNIGV